MRIAYVGLSSPVFYDYSVEASKTASDDYSSPNPILESPFGLMLLFDEIWFLCKSLCPENMRKLPYVKFLDQTKLLPNLTRRKYSELKEMQEQILNSNGINPKKKTVSYKFVRRNIGIYWDAAADIHTHELTILGKKFSASPRVENLFFDMEIVHHLSVTTKHEVEFITNSFSENLLETVENPILKTNLAETLTIDYVPNYLTPKGPYHPVIEDVRKNSYLKDFRKWVVKQKSPANRREILEIKRDVEFTLQDAQDKIFLEQFDSKGFFASTGKTILGAGVDILFPGLSTIASITQDGIDYWRNRERRWQAFLVSTKGIKSKVRIKR